MAPLASPLNVGQVTRAVDALLKHTRNTKNAGKAQLIESDDPISVLIGMKSIPDTGRRTTPYMIKLKNPLHTPGETEVCLIVKDPQRKYKDIVAEKGVKSIHRVIGVSKLKTKFKQYEAKRQLVGTYDVFLADDRVIPVLPHLLGKTFFERKKLPLPIDMSRNNLENEVSKALRSTPFYLSEGYCSTIKVGNSGMGTESLVANIVSAMEQVAEKLPKKWKNILSLNIKTHDSIALPIWNSLPESGAIAMPSKKIAPKIEGGQGGTPSKRKAMDVDDASPPKKAKIATPAKAVTPAKTPVTAKGAAKTPVVKSESAKEAAPAKAKTPAKPAAAAVSAAAKSPGGSGKKPSPRQTRAQRAAKAK